MTEQTLRWVLPLLAVAAIGCAEEGNSDSDKPEKDPLVVKSADDIEGEVSEEMQRKPYSELLVGQVTIHCPESISDNLAAGKTTECTARDESGNVGEFRIRSVRKGEQYEYSPGELVSAVSFGG